MRTTLHALAVLATFALAALAGVALLVGCGDGAPGGDGGPDGAADGDADGDTDGDGDTDSDSLDGECPSPETADADAGLLWRRCLAGECWDADAEACAGEALEVDFDAAADACPAPYRLPTRDELMGLLGDCEELAEDDEQTACAACAASALCDEAFPGTEELPEISRLHLHWSSTELDATNGWFARFKHGMVKTDDKTKVFTAVCVRDE